MKKMILVLATGNPGKKRELMAMLEGFPVEIRNLSDFGPIPEIKEDGATFDDNAYKKASLTARYLGFAAMADDSGLEVAALDGAPGVHSARYAGDNASDGANNEKLLAAMEGVENRKAAFKCVISIAVPTGQALTYEGSCEGDILREPRGDKGFGYDPLFFCPELQKTFGEADLEEKGRVSHRGRALTEVRREFDKILVWLEQNMPRLEKFDCVR
ncbi:XTP/dITP diphosphohydrolase [Desulfobotulus alkaliphilus]|uniref:dITP/XTP pyrophosphatase n=1 Tax=Desulfobotulus alkaliphilus TaxID=622671 RepID=A0A562RW94_9BACT|nr:XTP/dITP diphosphatase [Desulfobotulus alkaliphilus]TWI73288.1 XTP/dITP diphosphohydrolase [Desulfobotulus alkaliphilus]